MRFPGVQIVKRHTSALLGAPVTPIFEFGRLPARPNPASQQLYPATPLKQAFDDGKSPDFFCCQFSNLRSERDSGTGPDRNLPRGSSLRGVCRRGLKRASARSPPANTPERAAWWHLVQLDLDVDTRRKLELHQRVHGLVRGIDDVHQTLVRPDLVLVTSILVHVR